MKKQQLQTKAKTKLMRAINIAHNKFEEDGEIGVLTETLKEAHKTYHNDRKIINAIKDMEKEIVGLNKTKILGEK